MEWMLWLYWGGQLSCLTRGHQHVPAQEDTFYRFLRRSYDTIECITYALSLSAGAVGCLTANFRDCASIWSNDNWTEGRSGRDRCELRAFDALSSDERSAAITIFWEQNGPLRHTKTRLETLNNCLFLFVLKAFAFFGSRDYYSHSFKSTQSSPGKAPSFLSTT